MEGDKRKNGEGNQIGDAEGHSECFPSKVGSLDGNITKNCVCQEQPLTEHENVFPSAVLPVLRERLRAGCYPTVDLT
jgi:hypothetical protein